jgi:hypothetical protein
MLCEIGLLHGERRTGVRSLDVVEMLGTKKETQRERTGEKVMSSEYAEISS